MAKIRKMLNDINAPYMLSLMNLMQTQSKKTITHWCTSYAEKHLLPLWERFFPDDSRPREALVASTRYLSGEISLPEVKESITKCRNAAREAEGLPIAQGAARAIDGCVSSTHNSAAALGIALYGGLALAYYELGTDAPWETIEAIAAKECIKMENFLSEMAVPNETHPSNIKWSC